MIVVASLRAEWIIQETSQGIFMYENKSGVTYRYQDGFTLKKIESLNLDGSAAIPIFQPFSFVNRKGIYSSAPDIQDYIMNPKSTSKQ